jgi:hypothetical protein
MLKLGKFVSFEMIRPIVESWPKILCASSTG